MIDISIIPQNNEQGKSTSEKFTWKKFGFICLCIVWAVGIFIAAQFLVALIMTMFLHEQVHQPLWNAVFGALAYSLALVVMVVVPWLIHKKRKQQETDGKLTLSTTREEMGFNGILNWTDLGLCVAGLIAYFILAAIITWLCTMLCPWMDMNQVQDVGFNSLNGFGDRFIAFIALVVIAPIAEEIIFRGWLYGKIRSIIPGKVSMIISMLLVSIIFGVLHGQWNVGINVFVLSLVLCGLREITGTIYSGILVHMIKNGIAFYLLYVIGMGM